ncbi:TetR/AcrR family transcriptional regulator [Aquabacterium humicola]|uniref:TetR/AcrR family transcriptional regulator n=1 Tax=Aquabacterium humicola TaxID=3237377 RepID=UPI00254392BC|nr:TetR/AcrR family transcriptional regulator [Rubrivivax pictus]
MAAAGSSTRDRILETSLRLFNEDGVAAVSTHRIAAELGISPGNLHYHFKTKQLIVTWLFRRFEDRFAPCIDAAATVTALDDLWLSLHLTFEAVSAYRFVYRDIDYLLNEFPELEARAQALTARNVLAANGLCAGLAAAGVIDANAGDVEMLALQIAFTTTCWFTFKRLTPRPQDGKHAEAALAAYYTLTLLSPYVVGEARDYLNYLRAKYLR